MLNVWSLVLSLVMILGVSCDEILVILDNKNIHQTHSQFLAMLGEVHTVQFAYSFAKSKIELRHFDRFKYDHIILMATSEADSKSQIKINDVVNYFDEGGNVILIPDVDTSKSYRKLFYAFGVELDEYGSRIKDNFNFHANNDLIRTSQYAGRPFIMTEKPLLYRGIGLKLVNFENYQLYELITSESTAFSKNYIKDSTQRVGSLCLAAAVQGLNNARALILGSTEFFSDELFNLEEYGNKEAAIDLIAWTFQKSGVIRARDMFYHGEGAAGKETLFNVGEKIYYQVEVEIQEGYQWVPYSTNDLQVEFVMLDPWVRVGLQQQNSTSTYSASFYAPGKEGIYQFKIIYKKPGYTFLKEAERVTVRPYKHDEYERFLFVAHPYFFGLFATIFGTFIFIVVYLYSGFQTSKIKQE